MKENKKKNKRKYLILLLLLLLISLEFGFLYSVNHKSLNYINATTNRSLSNNQVTIDYDKPINVSTANEEYTQIMGYGLISIDHDHPFIYLMNPKDNNVYLSFDVYNNEKLLHSGSLIEPGNMESFDIYGCLDAGKHTLIYKISSYDINTKQTYWQGITQKQEIQINK